MIIMKSAADAEPTRRRYITGDGLESTVVTYFGLPTAAAPFEPPPVGTLYPVAFRVEQDPLTQAEPHLTACSVNAASMPSRSSNGWDPGASVKRGRKVFCLK